MDDLLQQWWEETHPNAGVKDIRQLSDGIITLEDLICFNEWLNDNYDIKPLFKSPENPFFDV